VKLAGRVAIVTGGAAGIGRVLAEGLAREGASIVIADLRGAEAAAAELEQAGHRALGLTADVTNEADTARMAAAAEAKFGGIDVLICNAAIFATLQPKPFEELSAAEWRQVMDVNTLGVFLSVKACLPAMSRSTAARIVTISSGVAFKGNALYLHYVASKGAVVSMTRSLARELGPRKILVNSIAPGFTLSDGVLNNQALLDGAGVPSVAGRALGRDMYPDDLVGAAVFFAGPDCGFVTGQTLVVDGGSYLH
jgi:NAD(P)-dependent dehydrogenase (short-subunit alcohol dehydrogenase family)